MPLYRLPANFWDDHVGRDLPGGKLVRRTSKHVLVELDQAAYDELLSDADHYASDQGWSPHLVGVRLSARATSSILRNRPFGT